MARKSLRAIPPLTDRLLPMLRIFLLALTMCLMTPAMVAAQSLQSLLQPHAEEVLKPGRRTVGVVLDDLVASGLPQALPFLEAWRDLSLIHI